MPTTSIWLLAVIDHDEPLPPEGKGLEKTMALALMGRPEISGARVSQVLRREGDQSAMRDAIHPEARVPEVSVENAEKKRVAEELARDIAQRCPNADDPGGPHEYGTGQMEGIPRVCLNCGQVEAPAPEGAKASLPLPQLPPPAPPKPNASGEVPCQHCGAMVKPIRLCTNCGFPPINRTAHAAPKIDPDRCPSSQPPGQPHDFAPDNANRGRCCPRCGCPNPNPPPPRRPPEGSFKGNVLMEG